MKFLVKLLGLSMVLMQPSWAEVGASVDYSQVQGLNSAVQKAYGSYRVQVAPLVDTDINLPKRIVPNVAIEVVVENLTNTPFILDQHALQIFDANHTQLYPLSLSHLQQMTASNDLADPNRQAMWQRDYEIAKAIYQKQQMQRRLVLPNERYRGVVYLANLEHSQGLTVHLKTDETRHSFKF